MTLAAAALLLVSALLALGTWQVHRLSWKLDLIAHVDRRVHAPAVAAPGPSAWPAVTAATDEYRHVSIAGTFSNDREALVQAVTDLGPGFWVLTPLVTDTGETILINRGFVPQDRRDPATRRAGQIGGPTHVVGLLRITEPKGGFLRTNDPVGNRWYSRDVAAIAAARGLRDVAPYFIDADATPNVGGWPVGGLTVIVFPNSHLVYAMTWYALAVMLAGAAVWVIRDELRSRKAGSVKPTVAGIEPALTP